MSSKASALAKTVAFFVFFVSIGLGSRRDTYLPFLSNAAFPYTLIKEVQVPDKANVETTIAVDAPDGTKIAYWGAKPSASTQPTPQAAYGDYSNAGVTIVQGGQAHLKFFCPSKYTIPWGRTLDRHIHFRLVNHDGMISPVQTTYVNC